MTPTQRKAMEQALAWIEAQHKDGCWARKTTAALRAALAEPQHAADEYGTALLSAWDAVRDPGPAGDDVPHPVFTSGFEAGWHAKPQGEPVGVVYECVPRPGYVEQPDGSSAWVPVKAYEVTAYVASPLDPGTALYISGGVK